MTLLACGTCGVSMLSTLLPPFGYWLQLLPIAFIAFHYIEWREGTFTLGKLVQRSLVGVIAFVASVAFLAFIIVPIVFLFVLILFTAKLASSDRKAKTTAGVILALSGQNPRPILATDPTSSRRPRSKLFFEDGEGTGLLQRGVAPLPPIRQYDCSEKRGQRRRAAR